MFQRPSMGEEAALELLSYGDTLLNPALPSAPSASRRQHSSIAWAAGRCLAQASAYAVEST
jgi:hypothetical protein